MLAVNRIQNLSYPLQDWRALAHSQSAAAVRNPRMQDIEAPALAGAHEIEKNLKLQPPSHALGPPD